MLLCFVDESEESDFFGFAGVVADDEVTESLTAELDYIMGRASRRYGMPETTEIHMYDLFWGNDVWSGVDVTDRVALYEDVIDAIVAEDVYLTMPGVSRARLKARQDSNNYRENWTAEQTSFLFLLQAVNELAKASKSHVLVIADERGKENGDRHRDMFTVYRRSGTPGEYKFSMLPTLLDTIHFAPSHYSRMLQAADVIAFTRRRRVCHPDEADPRKDELMKRIWQKIADSGRVRRCSVWPQG